MKTNLKEKLAGIDTQNTNANAIFQYDKHGMQTLVTKDTTVYELALLSIEVQKEVLRKCLEQNMDAKEAVSIIKGISEISLDNLMKEQLIKLFSDDEIIQKLLSK